MVLMPGRITLGEFVIGYLLLHGLFTLMWFSVAPVSAIPYCSRLVGGWLLHVFLVWLKFAKFSKLSSFFVAFKLLVLDPNSQRPCDNTEVLPPNLAVALTLDLWYGLLLLYYDPVWPPTPWLQQHLLLHQVEWWDCPAVYQVAFILLG